MKLSIKVKPMGDHTEIYLCQEGYGQGKEWDDYNEAVKMARHGVAKTLKTYLEKNFE